MKKHQAHVTKFKQVTKSRERSRRNREAKAMEDGREYHPNRGRAATEFERRDRRIVQKRNARLRSAIDSGREFRARSLHDAHVRAYIKQPPPLFVGPPKPTPALVGYAAYARFRYWSDRAYREYQINKRKKTVAEVPLAYAREQLGIKNAPPALVEAKRYFLLIKREIGETSNEDD